MQVSLSAILAEANSQDPWTSRARPTFLSVAAIALANGMNANLLRRWISMARGREMMMGSVTGTSTAVHGFVPLATPSRGSDRDVRIELSCGSMSIKVSWPVSAAGWLRGACTSVASPGFR